MPATANFDLSPTGPRSWCGDPEQLVERFGELALGQLPGAAGEDPSAIVDEHGGGHAEQVEGTGGDAVWVEARRVANTGLADQFEGVRSVSWSLMPTKATRPAKRRAARCSAGISRRHGTHHDAQKLTTTGRLL